MNIRELSHALAAAMAMADSGEIARAHLPELIRRPRTATVSSNDDEKKRAQLIELLRLHRGNISAVARDMKTSRSQIGRLLARLQINPRELD